MSIKDKCTMWEIHSVMTVTHGTSLFPPSPPFPSFPSNYNYYVSLVQLVFSVRKKENKYPTQNKTKKAKSEKFKQPLAWSCLGRDSCTLLLLVGLYTTRNVMTIISIVYVSPPPPPPPAPTIHPFLLQHMSEWYSGLCEHRFFQPM